MGDRWDTRVSPISRASCQRHQMEESCGFGEFSTWRDKRNSRATRETWGTGELHESQPTRESCDQRELTGMGEEWVSRCSYRLRQSRELLNPRVTLCAHVSQESQV